jgi:excisionase family DNA binding protein
MSTAEVKHLNPTQFSTQELDVFLFALAGRLKFHFANEVPMTKTEIAGYMKFSESKIDRWVRSGKLKAHRMEEGGDPRFLPSEALKALTGK